MMYCALQVEQRGRTAAGAKQEVDNDPVAVFGKGAGLAVRFLQQLLQLVVWNLSKACWMVGYALAADLKSRLRTRETPPFFAKNPSRPLNASRKWSKKKKPRIIRTNEQF